MIDRSQNEQSRTDVWLILNTVFQIHDYTAQIDIKLLGTLLPKLNWDLARSIDFQGLNRG